MTSNVELYLRTHMWENLLLFLSKTRFVKTVNFQTHFLVLNGGKLFLVKYLDLCFSTVYFWKYKCKNTQWKKILHLWIVWIKIFPQFVFGNTHSNIH